MNKKIKSIIEKEAIVYKKTNSKFFLTDTDSNWIFDFRRVFLQGKLLSDFSKFFWDKFEKYYPFQVGGMELGAIPLVSGIIIEGIKRGKEINGFFVRKDRKTTGLGNIIEGKLNNEKIIIVDDLLNSGKTVNKIKLSLEDLGKEIFKIFTFVNFGSEEGKKFIKANNLDFEYEFTLSDFGLDIFGNTKEIYRENYKAPVIYPKSQKIYSQNNANKFLLVPKSNPVLDGKNLILCGEGGKIISICKDTGNMNWEFKVGKVIGHKNIISSPIIIGETIVFGSYDGNLYCLNKYSGELYWKNIDAEWIGSSPVYSKKDNLIYIGFELGGTRKKGSLVAIDYSLGEKVWEVFFDDYVHCSPGYSKKLGMVICGGNDGNLIGVKAKTGKIVFKNKFESSIKGGFGFSNNEKIAYFGGHDNKLYCLELSTGIVKWAYETENVVYVKPLIIGGNIYFGGLDKYFYHFDKNGKLIKKIRTFGKIFSEAIEIKKGIIAFASNDSYVYIYDYVNKRVLFVIEHKERIQTKLIFDKNFGHLYIYDHLNFLYKYDIGGYL